jgi:hypothetical protein
MVYAWFGTGQIVGARHDGKLVWQRHLGTEISPFTVNWGHSSSPALFGDTVILYAITSRPLIYGGGQAYWQASVEGGSRQGRCRTARRWS